MNQLAPQAASALFIVADRPQFRRMLDEATGPNASFREILVWKFSRFTRKREHAVAFKSMLRRRGIRVVSITEHADDSPTGKLMEAIIESVDEFYSENLAQEVARGMREAASRGFWVASRTPYGYHKVHIQDGAKKRPRLEPDRDTAPVVERIFALATSGKGITEIARTLNDDSIANPTGCPWSKNGVHILLTNEVYTGTLLWGRNARDGAPPVRVEDTFPAIISKDLFSRAQSLMRSRAPRRAHPRRVGSSYLLSGIVRCRSCRRALSGQDSKSGKFSYYVCQSLLKRGRDACDAPRLNARRFESLVIDQIRANILTESNIRDLVRLLGEELDGVAREQRQRLKTTESELADVRRRLDRLYHLLETTELDISDVLPRVRDHKERRERLEGAASEARAGLSERRIVLDTCRDDHRLRPGDERVPGHERTDRVEGLHPLLRQGDRRRPRRGHDPLHDPHARGQSPSGAPTPRRSLSAIRYCLPSSLVELGGFEPPTF